MFVVSFKPSFVRNVNKLEPALRDEVVEKIELFKDIKNHKYLKVHKLHGEFAGLSAFSVNYKVRIYFQYESKNEAVLMVLDDDHLYR